MPDPFATARLEIACATETLKLAQATLDAATDSPEDAPANNVSTPPARPCDHIRNHRPGHPRHPEQPAILRPSPVSSRLTRGAQTG
jgi:hypothetical protein